MKSIRKVLSSAKRKKKRTVQEPPLRELQRQEQTQQQVPEQKVGSLPVNRNAAPASTKKKKKRDKVKSINLTEDRSSTATTTSTSTGPTSTNQEPPASTSNIAFTSILPATKAAAAVEHRHQQPQSAQTLTTVSNHSRTSATHDEAAEGDIIPVPPVVDCDAGGGRDSDENDGQRNHNLNHPQEVETVAPQEQSPFQAAEGERNPQYVQRTITRSEEQSMDLPSTKSATGTSQLATANASRTPTATPQKPTFASVDDDNKTSSNSDSIDGYEGRGGAKPVKVKKKRMKRSSSNRSVKSVGSKGADDEIASSNSDSLDDVDDDAGRGGMKLKKKKKRVKRTPSNRSIKSGKIDDGFSDDDSHAANTSVRSLRSTMKEKRRSNSNRSINSMDSGGISDDDSHATNRSSQSARATMKKKKRSNSNRSINSMGGAGVGGDAVRSDNDKHTTSPSVPSQRATAEEQKMGLNEGGPNEAANSASTLGNKTSVPPPPATSARAVIPVNGKAGGNGDDYPNMSRPIDTKDLLHEQREQLLKEKRLLLRQQQQLAKKKKLLQRRQQDMLRRSLSLPSVMENEPCYALTPSNSDPDLLNLHPKRRKKYKKTNKKKHHSFISTTAMNRQHLVLAGSIVPDVDSRDEPTNSKADCNVVTDDVGTTHHEQRHSQPESCDAVEKAVHSFDDSLAFSVDSTGEMHFIKEDDMVPQRYNEAPRKEEGRTTIRQVATSSIPVEQDSNVLLSCLSPELKPKPYGTMLQADDSLLQFDGTLVSPLPNDPSEWDKAANNSEVVSSCPDLGEDAGLPPSPPYGKVEGAGDRGGIDESGYTTPPPTGTLAGGASRGTAQPVDPPGNTTPTSPDEEKETFRIPAGHDARKEQDASLSIVQRSARPIVDEKEGSGKIGEEKAFLQPPMTPTTDEDSSAKSAGGSPTESSATKNHVDMRRAKGGPLSAAVRDRGGVEGNQNADFQDVVASQPKQPTEPTTASAGVTTAVNKRELSSGIRQDFSLSSKIQRLDEYNKSHHTSDDEHSDIHSASPPPALPQRPSSQIERLAEAKRAATLRLQHGLSNILAQKKDIDAQSSLHGFALAAGTHLQQHLGVPSEPISEQVLDSRLAVGVQQLQALNSQLQQQLSQERERVVSLQKEQWLLKEQAIEKNSELSQLQEDFLAASQKAGELEDEKCLASRMVEQQAGQIASLKQELEDEQMVQHRSIRGDLSRALEKVEQLQKEQWLLKEQVIEKDAELEQAEEQCLASSKQAEESEEQIRLANRMIQQQQDELASLRQELDRQASVHREASLGELSQALDRVAQLQKEQWLFKGANSGKRC